MTKEELFFKIGWKAASAFAWFMWVVGSFLSYWGFTHLSAVPLWVKVVAGGFAIGINIVEFVLNRMTLEEFMDMKTIGDAVLRLFGVVCYIYDCWSNILGFMLVFGYTSFMVGWNSDVVMTVFAIIFGVAFAIGPEPLYIKYLHEMEENKAEQGRYKRSQTTSARQQQGSTNNKPDYSKSLQGGGFTPYKNIKDYLDDAEN